MLVSKMCLSGMSLPRYGCMTARAKLAVVHVHSLRSNPCTFRPTNGLSEAMQKWAQQEIKTWDGSRLRAAVILAAKKRDLRIDEAGEVSCLNTSVPMRRAKGSMQCTEEMLSTFDFKQFIEISQGNSCGSIATIKTVLYIKLFSNCLETHGIDFLQNGIFLDSIIDMWNWQNLPIIEDVKFVVVETAAGWGVANNLKQFHECDSIEQSLALWYTLYFDSDPLGLKAYLNE